jgi:hypothetical protein
MKTLSLKHVKSILYVLAVAMTVMSTVACDKKSKGTEVSYRGNRGGNNQWQNPYYNPQTGQQTSEWGAIGRNGGFDNIIQDFLGTDQVGQVSGGLYDNTGIRFRGNASMGGEIQILVWDSVANTSGEAFFWSMHVVNVQNGSVTAQDGTGTITFQGQNNGGAMWSGTVYYSNNGGPSVPLGNFQISSQAIF